MTQVLEISRPDDFHVHLRQGAMLRAVLPYTANVFGRATVMPNLKKPITTTALAQSYRDEIRAALQQGSAFMPLMTLYLTEETDPDDLERGFHEKIVTAVKLYPAHATTNSAFGVTDFRKILKVVDRMQKLGMPLLFHGEVSDPGVDIFDREAVFLERVLAPLRRDFPALKIVWEHITTEAAAAYVADEGRKGTLAATITAHHLHLNRNDLLAGGLHPHYYCMPIAKREQHRKALIDAATSGEKMFFLGTDTAPHPQKDKESSCGCAGIFTAPNAMGCYAHIFDEAGKLSNLESFASRNGAAFYGLAPNSGKIRLLKEEPKDIKPILTGEGQTIIPFAPPSPVSWRVS